MEDSFWIHLLPWRQKDRPDSKSAQIKFSCLLALNQDGRGNHLELLIVNRSSWTVWVEQASISFNELTAPFQSAVPHDRTEIQVGRNIEPHKILRVDIAKVLYEAAGRPQRHYSCLVSTYVLYSVFNEWCKTKTKSCRVTMQGVNAVRFHSPRGGSGQVTRIQRSALLTTQFKKLTSWPASTEDV